MFAILQQVLFDKQSPSQGLLPAYSGQKHGWSRLHERPMPADLTDQFYLSGTACWFWYYLRNKLQIRFSRQSRSIVTEINDLFSLKMVPYARYPVNVLSHRFHG